jgi:hypothetical protein
MLPSQRFGSSMLTGLLGVPLVDAAWWPESGGDDVNAAVVDPGTPSSTRARVPPMLAPPSSLQPAAAFRMSPPATTRPSGSLQLDVQPIWADVYVDGFSVGSVESLEAAGGLSLAAGWHRLEFRAAGFRTASANVTIEAGRASPYRVALFPM